MIIKTSKKSLKNSKEEDNLVWIRNANLKLTTTGSNTTIDVRYTAIVNSLERHMCSNGMVLADFIEIWGIDPPGSYTGNIILILPSERLPVTAGEGQQTIERNRSITVTRASLQEDPGIGDNDEIRCKITIKPYYMPDIANGWTNQEVLLG
ncbi:MAG: hypothetical protein A4E49_00384 [Methanosaeta sp. PtaU1.Bin112]|nr:MAG: hypothetical protein A4E49_00384 [Methanosaeta sp. PtaU1.Bin112]